MFGKPNQTLTTLDTNGPKNAPQAPREREMWTANTFMVDLLNLFSSRINFHKSELILEERNARLPAHIARRSAWRRTACSTGQMLSSVASLMTFSLLLKTTISTCLL